jgi:dTDP-4-dehydrorhamnose 3,5-epimerase
MIEVRELDLPDVYEIRLSKFDDSRGFFSETWNEAALADAGISARFVQDNHSSSAARGVVRGLHLQLAPAAQAKLVRVARGAVFDVAVDVRPHSPTLGRWVGLVLSAEKWNQIFVPEGFAHGFMTIEPDSEVLYKVTAPYSPETERTIRFDDPALSINWPIAPSEIQLSDRDARAGTLYDLLDEIRANG